MAFRHVLYHPTKGVFLGVRDQRAVWGTSPESAGIPYAPHFGDRSELTNWIDANFEAEKCEKADMRDIALSDLRIVFPTDGRVGPRECKNSCLSGWGD